MAGLYRRGRIYWARAQRQGREYRRSLKTSNRAVAERRLAAWRDELDATAWGEKPRRSFDEAAERFIRDHLTTLKPSSAVRYGVSLKILAPHFGGKTLDRITTGALSDFETARRGNDVAPGTIRRDLACLSSLLTSCEDWEWVDAGFNPVPGYLRRRARRGLKEAPPRTRYLTVVEEERLLRAATADVIRAIVLAIDTGLRREELFSLTWRQIDLVRGLITTTTKTNPRRARKVPVTERSARILAQSPRYLDSPYVLVNPDTRLRFIQMNKGLAGAVGRSGIDPIRWHDLRRTAGCRWLQRDGKSMEEVSILLGHSSVAVTEQRYAFLEGETVAESLAHRTAESDA
jgi:integrase